MWRRSDKSGAGEGTLLAPGDNVIYQPISVREYEVLAAKAAIGELDLEPEEPAERWTGEAA
jgi:hypothetical protein